MRQVKKEKSPLYRWISAKTGLTPNRLSTIVKNTKAFNEHDLSALLSGGILTIDEIFANVDMDREERVYLAEFEHKRLMKMAMDSPRS
jgi:hypothetical protein